MIRIVSFGMYRDMYRIVTPVYRFTPTCKCCRSWSSLQLEACLKRWMVWKRSCTPSAESDRSSSESRAPPLTSPAPLMAFMPSEEPIVPSVLVLLPSDPDQLEDDRRGLTRNLAQLPDFCAQILVALSRQEEAPNQRFAALESHVGEMAARVTSPARPSPRCCRSPRHPLLCLCSRCLGQHPCRSDY